MCIQYIVTLYSTNANIKHDAMDKGSMFRVHGVENNDLSSTFSVC